MKKTLFIIILSTLFVSLLFSVKQEINISNQVVLDEMLDELATKAYDNFKEIPPHKLKDGDEPIRCAIMPINNDINDRLYNILSSKLTKTEFDFYDRKEIDTNIEELALQNNDLYLDDGSLNFGKFKHWKGAIFADMDYKSETFLLKKTHYLMLNVKMGDIETNGHLWHETFTTVRKDKFPITYLVIGLVALLFISILVNIGTKGVMTNAVLTITFILMILYAVWYFVV